MAEVSLRKGGLARNAMMPGNLKQSDGQGEACFKARRVLDEALVGGEVEHPDGTKVDVTANISPANSGALNRVVRERGPSVVVEIGMAHGVSTLSILAGLCEAGGGRLASIDPYIGWPTGRRIALHQVERAGFSHMHEHLHMPSHLGLTRLIERGVEPGLIYIDGCHDHDYVFADYFLSDQLLRAGGVMAFNDASWPSVHRVVRRVRQRRDYREMDVGLPRVYQGRNHAVTLAKRALGMSTLDRYFEKMGP